MNRRARRHVAGVGGLAAAVDLALVPRDGYHNPILIACLVVWRRAWRAAGSPPLRID